MANKIKVEGANKDIKKALLDNGVLQWVIAEAMGMSPWTFSVKLRKEFPEEEKKKCLTLIEKIAAERSA